MSNSGSARSRKTARAPTEARSSGRLRPRIVRPEKPAALQAATPPTSALSPESVGDWANDFLSVGHQPQEVLSERERKLLTTFEKHLVSLLTHELKTPFLGVMNGVSLLEFEMESTPAIQILSQSLGWAHLKRGVERLNQTLLALHDLIAIHSGELQLHLTEVNLSRVLEEWTRDIPFKNRLQAAQGARALVDLKRFQFAFESCLSAFESRLALSRQQISIELSERDGFYSLQFFAESSKLNPESVLAWNAEWRELFTAIQGGVYSPGSAFSGKILSENFLARPDSQRMTSDWGIAYPILRAHGGQLECFASEVKVGTEIRVPVLNSVAGLRALLESRIRNLGMNVEHLSRLWMCISPLPDASSFESALKDQLVGQVTLERVTSFYLSDSGKSVLIAEVSPRESGILENELRQLPDGWEFTWVDASVPVDLLLNRFF